MLIARLTTLFLVVDFLAVFVGAIGGALAAIRDTRSRYDVVGVVGLAFASALGGGIARDVILQHGPPLAFLDIRYLAAAFAGAFVALLFRQKITSGTERALTWVDATAIGLFSVAGSTRALDAGLGEFAALLLGVVTAVGGGCLRDVLSGRTPKIFEGGQLYAIAALSGSASFLVCDYFGVDRTVSTVVGTSAGTLLRILSVRFDWRTRPVGSATNLQEPGN